MGRRHGCQCWRTSRAQCIENKTKTSRDNKLKKQTNKTQPVYCEDWRKKNEDRPTVLELKELSIHQEHVEDKETAIRGGGQHKAIAEILKVP